MPWTPRGHPGGVWWGRSRHRQSVVRDQPGRSVGRIGWPPLVTHREGCVGWLTTAQGVTPVQWRHVRAALVTRSGQGCCLPRAAVGLGTPSLSGDCSTR